MMFLHMHKKCELSLGKVHNYLCDREQDICDCYIEAFCHKSPRKEGNPHHNIAVYKHGAHNHVLADIFFHKLNLGSKEPVSSSCRIGKTS